MVKPIQDIIGQSEISLWTDKLNLKRPREGSGFGWHQDSPYWIHDSANVDLLPNVYLAIDNSNEEMLINTQPTKKDISKINKQIEKAQKYVKYL